INTGEDINQNNQDMNKDKDNFGSNNNNRGEKTRQFLVFICYFLYSKISAG
ncbi:MAG: hypothetical protein RIR57_492, partial [Bacteroidota bacterium]